MGNSQKFLISNCQDSDHFGDAEILREFLYNKTN